MLVGSWMVGGCSAGLLFVGGSIVINGQVCVDTDLVRGAGVVVAGRSALSLPAAEALASLSAGLLLTAEGAETPRFARAGIAILGDVVAVAGGRTGRDEVGS